MFYDILDVIYTFFVVFKQLGCCCLLTLGNDLPKILFFSEIHPDSSSDFHRPVSSAVNQSEFGEIKTFCQFLCIIPAFKRPSESSRLVNLAYEAAAKAQEFSVQFRAPAYFL